MTANTLGVLFVVGYAVVMYLLLGVILLLSTYVSMSTHPGLRQYAVRRSPWLRWYWLVFLWPIALFKELRDPE